MQTTIKQPDIKIAVDLDNLSKKAVKFGPLHVLAETFMSLLMMMNDQTRGRYKKPDNVKEKTK